MEEAPDDLAVVSILFAQVALYTSPPVRRRRHPTTGQWSPYSSPRLVLITTPPVRRRGGTWRLGSGLHTLRPGLYCIRLHQLGGEEAPGDWAVVFIPFAQVVLYTTPPVRRRGGTWRLGSGLHTLRPGCIVYDSTSQAERRDLATGQWSPYSSPRLYCIRLHQLGGEEAPGDWAVVFIPFAQVVLYTTPPVRRRGGTWRLGSGLHTLRPGCIVYDSTSQAERRDLATGQWSPYSSPRLYCIRLHQLGGGGNHCLSRRMSMGHKVLLYSFSALRLIVRCADITSHHSDGHLHCTVTGLPSNNALWTYRVTTAMVISTAQ